MGRTLGNGRYIKDALLGKGTFGEVVKAQDTQTGEFVAVKQIFVKDRGMGVDVTALREIKLLKELQHKHVIQLLDVFVHKGAINLVFELMDTDLEAIIKERSIVLSPGDIKAYMQMTLRALAFCHSKWVLHRDMKPNNLFLSTTGNLKLGDFGLSRIFGSPNPHLTCEVFATWYRAPELLFGSRAYGPAVDVWGVACVFAELLNRSIFMPGESTLDQLGKIFQKFGTPKESNWPGVTCLPDYVEFYPTPPQPLKSFFPAASDDALDLLSRMFSLDPNKRITAQQALEHRYFTSPPLPTNPANLPRPIKKREQARVGPVPLGLRPKMSPLSDEDGDGDGDEPPAQRSRTEGVFREPGGAVHETPGGMGAPMSVDGSKPQGAKGQPPATPNDSGTKPIKRKLHEMFSPS